MVQRTARGSERQSAPSSPPVHQCALCGNRRQTGSVLTSRPGPSNDMLWVCGDCQHKLSRRVDDEGTLGG